MSLKERISLSFCNDKRSKNSMQPASLVTQVGRACVFVRGGGGGMSGRVEEVHVSVDKYTLHLLFSVFT